MAVRNSQHPGWNPLWIALAIAGIYGFAGALWIGYSDQFVASLEPTTEQMTRLQQYKGWGYVAATAVLLFIALHILLQRLDVRYRELEASHAHLGRLYRTQAMIRAIKSALARSREVNVLLQEACRIAVLEGGYRLAWAALLEPDGRCLHVAAHSGAGEHLISGRRYPLSDLPADSPVGRAVATGCPSFYGKLEADPLLDGKGGPLARLGYRSAGALPMLAEGQLVGILTLYADTENAFTDPEERRLLEEIAENLALGLRYIQQGEALEELVHYDGVTGLPNRNLIELRLTEALARAERQNQTVGVVVLDIDDFRALNDTVGREAGDRALQAIAQLLSSMQRPGDVVGRLGNDEFAVVFADLPDHDALNTLVGTLADCFPQDLSLGNHSTPLRASMGVAVHPGDADDADTLIRRAETALHEITPDTPAIISFYAPQMNERAARQRKIDTSLRTAIEKNEFVLHWQPILRAQTGKLRFLEALTRWHNPELGDMSPDEFIPRAERTGLMIPIGDWILHEACRQGEQWSRAGHSVGINVNIALQQLQHPGFVKETCRLAKEAQRAGWQLVLEITESEFMSDPENTLAVCQELRAAGCGLHLDDFGTGYSALAYLTRLPLTGLKIDRTFIQGMETERSARAIVEAVITLSQHMNLDIVAEGVETERQAKLVRTLGCHYVQGFLYSRPIPEAAMSQWLTNRATAAASV